MNLGLDTDILVHFAMAGAPKHRAVRSLIRTRVAGGCTLAITQQVLWEFIHVTTDSRRFQHPLSMQEALQRARQWWRAQEVLRVLPDPIVLERACTQMERLKLGRKRILDTVLVCTLQSAGVNHLATLNSKDFHVFPSLEIIQPDLT